VPGPIYVWNPSKPNVTTYSPTKGDSQPCWKKAIDEGLTVLSVEIVVVNDPCGQPLPDAVALEMVICDGSGLAGVPARTATTPVSTGLAAARAGRSNDRERMVGLGDLIKMAKGK
jgi:hypothetical protein